MGEVADPIQVVLHRGGRNSLDLHHERLDGRETHPGFPTDSIFEDDGILYGSSRGKEGIAASSQGNANKTDGRLLPSIFLLKRAIRRRRKLQMGEADLGGTVQTDDDFSPSKRSEKSGTDAFVGGRNKKVQIGTRVAEEEGVDRKGIRLLKMTLFLKLAARRRGKELEKRASPKNKEASFSNDKEERQHPPSAFATGRSMKVEHNTQDRTTRRDTVEEDDKESRGVQTLSYHRHNAWQEAAHRLLANVLAGVDEGGNEMQGDGSNNNYSHVEPTIASEGVASDPTALEATQPTLGKPREELGTVTSEEMTFEHDGATYSSNELDGSVHDATMNLGTASVPPSDTDAAALDHKAETESWTETEIGPLAMSSGDENEGESENKMQTGEMEALADDNTIRSESEIDGPDHDAAQFIYDSMMTLLEPEDQYYLSPEVKDEEDDEEGVTEYQAIGKDSFRSQRKSSRVLALKSLFEEGIEKPHLLKVKEAAAWLKRINEQSKAKKSAAATSMKATFTAPGKQGAQRIPLVAL